MTTDIQVLTKYLPSSDRSLPALALQVIRLADSYMLWIGTTELAPEQVAQAPSQGNLAIDWACAMPPLNVRVTVCVLFYTLNQMVPKSNTPAATALFRSASSDVAFGMAQRLGDTLHSFHRGPIEC